MVSSQTNPRKNKTKLHLKSGENVYKQIVWEYLQNVICTQVLVARVTEYCEKQTYRIKKQSSQIKVANNWNK